MASMTPTNGKAEWHLTYRCSLRCASCSRAAWLNPPHTEDMTIADAEEWCRQASEFGWLYRMPDGSRPRIIIIGGEPTVHPQFLDFVKLVFEWSNNYVQVFTNNNTPKTRQMLERARLEWSAAICLDGAKQQGSITHPDQYPGWWMYQYVSPADAGLPDGAPCYVHSTQICGIGIDHDGYTMCAIGGTLRALLGLPKTKRFADLFDPEIAARFTAEDCRHCGYEYIKRPVTHEMRVRFMEYAKSCPVIDGAPMSPTWQRAFEARKAAA